MEKHYFTLKDNMSLVEQEVVNKLDEWIKELTTSDSGVPKRKCCMLFLLYIIYVIKNPIK